MVGIKSDSEHIAYLFEKMNEYEIPDYMQNGLVEYIMLGRPTGHFLAAVLENKLKEAVNRADDLNQARLVNYVKFLHNHAPNGCYGYEGVMSYWRERGGLAEITRITK